MRFFPASQATTVLPDRNLPYPEPCVKLILDKCVHHPIDGVYRLACIIHYLAIQWRCTTLARIIHWRSRTWRAYTPNHAVTRAISRPGEMRDGASDVDYGDAQHPLGLVLDLLPTFRDLVPAIVRQGSTPRRRTHATSTSPPFATNPRRRHVSHPADQRSLRLSLRFAFRLGSVRSCAEWQGQLFFHCAAHDEAITRRAMRLA